MPMPVYHGTQKSRGGMLLLKQLHSWKWVLSKLSLAGFQFPSTVRQHLKQKDSVTILRCQRLCLKAAIVVFFPSLLISTPRFWQVISFCGEQNDLPWGSSSFWFDCKDCGRRGFYEFLWWGNIFRLSWIDHRKKNARRINTKAKPRLSPLSSYLKRILMFWRNLHLIIWNGHAKLLRFFYAMLRVFFFRKMAVTVPLLHNILL